MFLRSASVCKVWLADLLLLDIVLPGEILAERDAEEFEKELTLLISLLSFIIS